MRYYLDEISADMDGAEVEVCGWVHEIRDLGGIKFIILRDAYEKVQITVTKGAPAEVLNSVKSIKKESALRVYGRVKEMKNAPRSFEIVPEKVYVLSRANTVLPLDPTRKVNADIDTRLDKG